jgi:hypothetical protein
MNAKYYRNKEEVGCVESDSLWELCNDFFILIDEDEYVEVSRKENEIRFYVVNLT